MHTLIFLPYIINKVLTIKGTGCRCFSINHSKMCHSNLSSTHHATFRWCFHYNGWLWTSVYSRKPDLYVLFMTAPVRCDGLLSGYILNSADYEWFHVAGPNASNAFFCMSVSHSSTQLSHLQCRVTPPTPTLWPYNPLEWAHTHTHVCSCPLGDT